MASPFLQYNAAAKVDRGGRNRNGRTLRREHLEAQRTVAERIMQAHGVDAEAARAKAREILDRVRETEDIARMMRSGHSAVH